MSSTDDQDFQKPGDVSRDPLTEGWDPNADKGGKGNNGGKNDD